MRQGSVDDVDRRPAAGKAAAKSDKPPRKRAVEKT